MVASLFYLEDGRLPVKKPSSIRVVGNEVDCYMTGPSIQNLQLVYRGQGGFDGMIIVISSVMRDDFVYKVRVYLPDERSLSRYLTILVGEPLSLGKRLTPVYFSKEHIFDHDVYVYSRKWSLHSNENWEGEGGEEK